MLQRKLRPSIARVNIQLDPRHAASKHTTAPINHTRPSPRKHSPDVATRARKQTSDCSLLLIYRPRKDERLSWPGWLVTYRNKVPPPGVEPRHVTHPSTNRARRRVTSLIRATPLPLGYATLPTKNRYIWLPLLRLKFKPSDGAGFPWDDLRNIYSKCQWMAKVPNGVEILLKIPLSRVQKRYRQTTDGRAYSWVHVR